jgi:hypothetical protein
VEDIHQIMMLTVDTTIHLAEAAFAAPASCWPNVDASRRSGYGLALAGRDAR